MKNAILLLLVIGLVISCSKEADLVLNDDLDAINQRSLDLETSTSTAPCFEATLIQESPDDCCTYEIKFTPKKKINNAYIRGNGQMIKGTPNREGCFEWKIEICDDAMVELWVDNGEIVKYLCAKNLTCERVPPECCEACYNWTYLGQIGKDCHLYEVEVVGGNGRCEWEIERVYSKEATSVTLTNPGSSTAIIQACYVAGATPPFGMGFVASNSYEECADFNTGFFNPELEDQENPNECGEIIYD